MRCAWRCTFGAALARRLATSGLLGIALARAAAAQDFAGASPPGSDGDPGGLLERALPPASRHAAAAATQTRWWGLPELETRAVSAGGGWRSLRVSLGLSQTGTPELGWTALALAAGAASTRAGAGVRACTRRDRDAPWSVARAVTGGAGVEAGAGAWLVPAARLRVWASAPQVWSTSGVAPPLSRPLELGVRAGDATAAWLRLVAPRDGDDGERALGVSLALAPLQAWAEVRDAPLRGAIGMNAALAGLGVGVRIDSHPALGETVRVQLAWQHAARAAP